MKYKDYQQRDEQGRIVVYHFMLYRTTTTECSIYEIPVIYFEDELVDISNMLFSFPHSKVGKVFISNAFDFRLDLVLPNKDYKKALSLFRNFILKYKQSANKVILDLHSKRLSNLLLDIEETLDSLV